MSAVTGAQASAMKLTVVERGHEYRVAIMSQVADAAMAHVKARSWTPGSPRNAEAEMICPRSEGEPELAMGRANSEMRARPGQPPGATGGDLRRS